MCVGGAQRALLVHLNIILAVFGGAMLVTSARLALDPSTYVVLRELLPAEYRAAVAALAVVGASRVLLAHVAAALGLWGQPGCVTKLLLILYLAAMGALLLGEIAWMTWSTIQLNAWLASEHAQFVQEVAVLKEQLKPVLVSLAKWVPASSRINELIKEAEEDAPRNGYAAAGAAAVYLVAQMASLVTAALMLKKQRRRHFDDPPPSYQSEVPLLLDQHRQSS